MKICTNCKQTKADTEFEYYSTPILQGRCKACVDEYYKRPLSDNEPVTLNERKERTEMSIKDRIEDVTRMAREIADMMRRQTPGSPAVGQPPVNVPEPPRPSATELTPQEIEARREAQRAKRQDGESDYDYALRMEKEYLSTLSRDEVQAYWKAKREAEAQTKREAQKKDELRAEIVEVLPDSSFAGGSPRFMARVKFRQVVDVTTGERWPDGDEMLIGEAAVFTKFPTYTERQLLDLQAAGQTPEQPVRFTGTLRIGMTGKLGYACEGGPHFRWWLVLDAV